MSLRPEPRVSLRQVGLSALAALLILTGAGATIGSVRAGDGTAPTKTTQLSEEQRAACADDFKRLCPFTFPGGGRVKACFDTHAKELSPLCRAAYDANLSTN